MIEWTPPSIIAVSSATATSAAFDRLVDSLHIPVCEQPSARDWILHCTNDALTLVRPDGVKLSIDFTAGKARHRSKESGQGAGVLRRALGIAAFRKRHGRRPDIIDATGGWGQDAWAIASTDCRVTLIEQHAVVHALLANALDRALIDSEFAPVASLLTLRRGDAIQTLPAISADIVYLDPMYPARVRKKADSKKGMQFLRALLGPADESLSECLLAAALENPAERVVVKRPKVAKPLDAPASWSGQRTTIESPNTRYDVYLKR